MKFIIKILINNTVKLLFFILYKFKSSRFIIDLFIHQIRNNTQVIKHENINYYFSSPNSLAFYRINTFSTKEPETLDWIKNFKKNSVFWDIGANIGLYSIYAAKISNAHVFSFEPSVFNLEFIAKNIKLNNLDGNICIIPLPLSDSTQFNTMRMSNIEWGGALSSFEKNIGWDGNKLNEVFNYQILGSTIDDMVQKFHLPLPNYIKIDVDGIEHFILQGGTHVLSYVDQILIEINDDFKQQAINCEEILIKSGFALTTKTHSLEFEEIGAFGGGKVWNQIWSRV